MNWKILKTFKHNQGFTLIEIIATLVIIGVLGALLTERVFDVQAEAITARDIIKSHIRYSQIMAMKSNTTCGIQFNGNSYSIFRNNSTSDKITLPGNDGKNFPISSKLGTASETIYFDLWGTPYTSIALTSQRHTGTIGNLGITLTKDTGQVQ